MCSYLVGKGGSEMKRIQKDYKVKMYILRESANQNVVIVGERNDENQAVPSVMKLIEKLIDEEVGEMILETDVDDTRCSEQIVDVPVPQIAERIVAVVAAFHGSESQNESLLGSSTCQDTHKVVEQIIKDFQSPAASCERTGSKDGLKTRPSSEPVNKF